MGIFADLSKAFDTVSHQILLKKVKLYGVTGNNYSWFENCRINRKQCVVINNGRNTSFQDIICGVLQGYILGPLLFILYINDLKKVSNALDPIVFADNTDLFISDKHNNALFTKANLELQKMSEWFKANKLSLNTKKSVFSLYHKSTQKHNLPSAFPILKIEATELKKKLA